MDKDMIATVPLAAYEVMTDRMAKSMKWMIGLCVVLVIALIATNMAWIVYENSYADQVTVTQDTPNGNNNYIGRDGGITNGATDNNN